MESRGLSIILQHDPDNLDFQIWKDIINDVYSKDSTTVSLPKKSIEHRISALFADNHLLVGPIFFYFFSTGSREYRTPFYEAHTRDYHDFESRVLVSISSHRNNDVAGLDKIVAN